jgi:NAD-dependent deacetylase
MTILEKAEEMALCADHFLCIGSSLVVQPAASFPVIAKKNGARLVIINQDPTPLDDMADLVLHERASEGLVSAVQMCLQQL